MKTRLIKIDAYTKKTGLSLMLVFLASSLPPAFADLQDDFSEEEPQPPEEKPNDPQEIPDPGKEENSSSDSRSNQTSTQSPQETDSKKNNNTESKEEKHKTVSNEEQKKLPVNIFSEGASALREEGIVELIKNVAINQGDLKLNSDKAKVYFDNDTNEVQKVIAEGKVLMEKVDVNTGKKIKAYGNKVTYVNSDQKIVLEGNAKLYRGKDIIKGKRIIYDMKTGWIKADKIEGVLHPEKNGK